MTPRQESIVKSAVGMWPVISALIVGAITLSEFYYSTRDQMADMHQAITDERRVREETMTRLFQTENDLERQLAEIRTQIAVHADRLSHLDAELEKIERTGEHR